MRTPPQNNQSNDIVDVATRTRMMRAVRQRDTRPELIVRTLLSQMGLYYRIRNKDLPGSPDIANRSKRWVIFVNGCFWHGHKHCKKTKSNSQPRVPKTRTEFWSAKFSLNRARDAARCKELRKMGYRVFIIWECGLNDRAALASRLRPLLQSRKTG
jgi:DNA mismatch endonuclease, patch repair protein